MLSRQASQLASGTPSALLDWNNNYGEDPNKAVCFHCSNLPRHFFNDVKMDYQAIIAGTVGIENTFGTCVGKVKAAPMSYARFSTDDTSGRLRGYVGEGKFTDDALNTFGCAGVVEIPQMQKLLAPDSSRLMNIIYGAITAPKRKRRDYCGRASRGTGSYQVVRWRLLIGVGIFQAAALAATQSREAGTIRVGVWALRSRGCHAMRYHRR
jgi:hypothetical protein